MRTVPTNGKASYNLLPRPSSRLSLRIYTGWSLVSWHIVNQHPLSLGRRHHQECRREVRGRLRYWHSIDQQHRISLAATIHATHHHSMRKLVMMGIMTIVYYLRRHISGSMMCRFERIGVNMLLRLLRRDHHQQSCWKISV